MKTFKIQRLNHVRSNLKLQNEKSIRSLERVADLKQQVQKLDDVEREWNEIKEHSINFSFEVKRSNSQRHKIRGVRSKFGSKDLSQEKKDDKSRNEVIVIAQNSVSARLQELQKSIQERKKAKLLSQILQNQQPNEQRLHQKGSQPQQPSQGSNAFHVKLERQNDKTEDDLKKKMIINNSIQNSQKAQPKKTKQLYPTKQKTITREPKINSKAEAIKRIKGKRAIKVNLTENKSEQTVSFINSSDKCASGGYKMMDNKLQKQVASHLEMRINSIKQHIQKPRTPQSEVTLKTTIEQIRYETPVADSQIRFSNLTSHKNSQKLFQSPKMPLIDQVLPQLDKIEIVTPFDSIKSTGLEEITEGKQFNLQFKLSQNIQKAFGGLNKQNIMFKQGSSKDGHSRKISHNLSAQTPLSSVVTKEFQMAQCKQIRIKHKQRQAGSFGSNDAFSTNLKNRNTIKQASSNSPKACNKPRLNWGAKPKAHIPIMIGDVAAFLSPKDQRRHYSASESFLINESVETYKTQYNTVAKKPNQLYNYHEHLNREEELRGNSKFLEADKTLIEFPSPRGMKKTQFIEISKSNETFGGYSPRQKGTDNNGYSSPTFGYKDDEIKKRLNHLVEETRLKMKYF